jgi:hypothetical protein
MRYTLQFLSIQRVTPIIITEVTYSKYLIISLCNRAVSM